MPCASSEIRDFHFQNCINWRSREGLDPICLPSFHYKTLSDDVAFVNCKETIPAFICLDDPFGWVDANGDCWDQEDLLIWSEELEILAN
jgi:hypothetical protein